MNNYSKGNGLRMWVISNMYPSKTNPRYGVFVENFVCSLELLNVEFPLKTFIYGSSGVAIFDKIYNYFKFYFSILKGIICKSKDFDCIYVHFPLHSAFLLLLSRKPIFLNFHGSEISRTNTLSKILFYFLRILSNRKATKIVVPSRFFLEKVNSILDLSNDKYIVYPSGGIDKTNFKPFTENEISNLKSKYNCNHNVKIIGFISNLIEGKGIWTYLKSIEINSAKSIDKKVFYIVGDGPLKDEVRSFIKNKNLQELIRLIPAQNQKTLAELFNLFDVFVFPSHREEESLGLVGIEAMACGTPVVGANNGGIKTYIEHGHDGFLFEPKNYIELSKLIEVYIQLTKNEIQQLRKNAILKASKFESEKVNLKLINEIKEWISILRGF